MSFIEKLGELSMLLQVSGDRRTSSSMMTSTSLTLSIKKGPQKLFPNVHLCPVFEDLILIASIKQGIPRLIGTGVYEGFIKFLSLHISLSFSVHVSVSLCIFSHTFQKDLWNIFIMMCYRFFVPKPLVCPFGIGKTLKKTKVVWLMNLWRW